MEGVTPEPWEPWAPQDVSERLAGVEVPWYVAGGWAIDLFLGEQRRVHDDLEIALPASRFGDIAHLLDDGLEWYVPIDGVLLQAIDPKRLDQSHQTWLRDPATGMWKLDVFREPERSGRWVCRRDPALSLPYDEIVSSTTDGIPFARPEIVLLFKAKAARPKDEEDLRAALPRMTLAARQWLVRALEHVHPTHPWIERAG